MMRRFLWKAALTVPLGAVVVAAIGAPTAPEALVCPAQALYRKIELKEQGVFAENCRDQQGLRQGPYRFRRLSDGSTEVEGTYVDNKQDGPTRSYDAEGELLYTTFFMHGTAGEVKFTRSGLAVLSNEANEYLRQDGKQVFVYPSGDTGITVEHTAPIPSPGRLSPEDAQRFRRKFLPLMCGLLARHPDLQSINLRVFWAGGEIASVEKFRARQCVASTYPSSSSAREP